MSSNKHALSLEELEASLKDVAGSLPPGFDSASVPRVASPPTYFSLITSSTADPFGLMMTERERRLITRMHISQMKSEFPEIEDYYYLNYNAASAVNDEEADENSLLFPLPQRYNKKTPKKPTDGKATDKVGGENLLLSEFGKVSKSTTARPRQQLSFPPLPPQPTGDDEFAVPKLIEEMHLAAIKEEAVQAILGRALDNLPAVLATGKGQKALKAVVRKCPPESAESVVDSLIDSFELLSVSRPKAKQAECDGFIANVLTAVAPLISEFSGERVLEKCTRWLSKKAFSWLIYSRLGVVLTCMLLSRAELCKQQSPGPSAELEGEYTAALQNAFIPLMEHVNDIFEFAAPSGTSDFYVWQLFALVAVNLDRNQKRQLVAELRERIMGVIAKNEANALATLNLFLNAIGLDASQLRQAL